MKQHGLLIWQMRKELSSQGGVAPRDAFPPKGALCPGGKGGWGEPNTRRGSAPALRPAGPPVSYVPRGPPTHTAAEPPPAWLHWSPAWKPYPSPQPLDLFILIQLHTQYELCKQKITRCNNWILSWTGSLLGCGVQQFPDTQPCPQAPPSLSKMRANI